MKPECVSKKNHLSYIDILKGFGIILVVFGHIYHNDIVVSWFYSFHMPLFFFAAGWLYKEKPVVVDIKRRFKTIMIPYFCFGSLTLLYWQLFERHFRNSDMSFVQSLFGLISGQYDYLDFNVHLWFLPCFFTVVIFYNILVRLGGGYGKIIATSVSIIMSAIYIVIPLPSLPLGFDRVFRFIWFYAIGTILFQIKFDGKVRRLRIPFAWIIAAFLFIISFLLSCKELDTGIMYFVAAMIGTIATLVISISINKNCILEYLGKISLVILCIHGPVYRIVVKVVSVILRFDTDAARETFVLVFIVTALTLGICVIAQQIINRYVPWMIGQSKTNISAM